MEAPSLLDRVLAGTPASETPLRHRASQPARSARFAEWPQWIPAELRERLERKGLNQPWSHQIETAESAWGGEHVVLATGTASGKSLPYQLVTLSALLNDDKATALYLAPTKALGADQLRAIQDLDLPGIRPASYDGDTPQAERRWVREHARWIVTNPDMLHLGILPNHRQWARLFRRLRYVVIDECHGYRGVFGSHVALLLRRLRRIAASYGADPVFILASATVAEPETLARQLTGVDCRVVAEDGSPRGARTLAFWEPPLLEHVHGENGAAVRRSAPAEAARILTDLVIEKARTLAFVRSRRGVETAALAAKHALSDVDAELAQRVSSYRGGYLPEQRRELERALLSGEILGLATTNALELGVDIAGLDAVIIAGFPGTLAALWQQAGRAGRSGREALVMFVARDDPLDTYLVHHPEAVMDRPVEASVLDPSNPYVLEPHLTCAAAELPLSPQCLDNFGGGLARQALERLVERQALRARPRGWFWTGGRYPHRELELRGSGGQPTAVVETESGRMLGTVDADSTYSTVHPGALYVHQGESFVVDELDLDNGLAWVHAESPEWTTWAREDVDIRILATNESRELGMGVWLHSGSVEVSSQVVGYLRRLPAGEVLDQVGLDLPEQKLATRAVWYTLSDDVLTASAPGGAGLDPARFPGALHAAEHGAIGLLPLFASCDRWDIGGVSAPLHRDTGQATVFVHDGHPGGAGFADRGYAAFLPWLAATREAIVSCECSAGCPSCVHSPKCGNGNEPLSKDDAVAVLDAVLATQE